MKTWRAWTPWCPPATRCRAARPCSAATPSLLIQQLPTSQIQITWLADATGFGLEQADALSAPVQWRAVGETAINVGHDAILPQKTLSVVEKGGHTHRYYFSTEGLQAIQDYVSQEREEDQTHWSSPARLAARTARLI